MLIDSHCHLQLLDLAAFDNNLDNVMAAASANDVKHLLCVCVDPSEFPTLCNIAASYKNISISVGLHPANIVINEPTQSSLSDLAQHEKCIAIGETGLDYSYAKDDDAQKLQQQRFITHINAALSVKKPLIIHTRMAAEDTINIMAHANADKIGGVMHCFTESLEVAQRALDLNFYISISGIVTFKNAQHLRDIVKYIPLDRLLIETDAPYLTPEPYRGTINHPALVKYIALTLSKLYNTNFDELSQKTTDNFYNCFNLKRKHVK